MKQTSPSLELKQLTPILTVDRIEPCLHFWTERLGFRATNQVPGEDGNLVFASVEKGDIEIMYQTRASVSAARPAEVADLVGHSTVLFITVADLDAIESVIDGVPIVTPRHRTFYGSTEIYVREPGGNKVGFAQMS